MNCCEQKNFLLKMGYLMKFMKKSVYLWDSSRELCGFCENMNIYLILNFAVWRIID